MCIPASRIHMLLMMADGRLRYTPTPTRIHSGICGLRLRLCCGARYACIDIYLISIRTHTVDTPAACGSWSCWELRAETAAHVACRDPPGAYLATCGCLLLGVGGGSWMCASVNTCTRTHTHRQIPDRPGTRGPCMCINTHHLHPQHTHQLKHLSLKWGRFAAFGVALCLAHVCLEYRHHLWVLVIEPVKFQHH